MVRDAQSRLIRDLGARFPKAKLVRDEKGEQGHGRESRPVHRRAVPAFRAATRYPRHRAAAARLERGAQDPVRRDLHLLDHRRGDRNAESDPRGRQRLLTELVCLRRPVSPRAAHGRRDGAAPARRPPVPLGRLRGEARREAARADHRRLSAGMEKTVTGWAKPRTAISPTATSCASGSDFCRGRNARMFSIAFFISGSRYSA